MDSRPQLVLFLAAVTLSFTGCSSHRPTEGAQSTAQAAAPKVRAFAAKGVIKELNPEKLTATIAHEEIPDYMAAMTMDFNVKDANELKGLAPGDEVTFRLNVTEDRHWIDQVTRGEKTAGESGEVGTPLTKPSRWRLVRDVEPLDVGDPMPNYQFTNELGQAMNLDDLKGTAYAFTFIFTRCPLPEFCPRMSSNFQTVQDTLKKQDKIKSWRLLSITMDPEFDTPLVLKTYAARFKQDNSRWSFLTAPLIDITAIGEQFGLEFYRPDGTIAHNIRTVVVDAAGRVQNIIIGNTWKPGDLVNYLETAAAAEPDSVAGKSN